METVRITTSQNIDIDYEVAGLGERIVAYIIDWALFVLLIILTVIGFELSGHRPGTETFYVGIFTLVYGAMFVFYDLLCETFMNGQSIGKRVMKIKVISLDGKQPSFGQYLLRWLFRLVDFSITFYAGGLLSIALTEKHQRIGDIVAGTTLIKTLPRTQINHLSYLNTHEAYHPIFPEAGQLSEKDITLVQEVINTYMKTQNNVIVYNMALRIREYLGVVQPPEMSDLKFLQNIVKDYGHVVTTQEGIV